MGIIRLCRLRRRVVDERAAAFGSVGACVAEYLRAQFSAWDSSQSLPLNSPLRGYSPAPVFNVGDRGIANAKHVCQSALCKRAVISVSLKWARHDAI